MNALKTPADNLKKVVSNLNAFNKCLSVVPATQYPGYLADDGAGGVIQVPALDVTATGDPIDIWLTGILAGDCGFPTVAKPVGSRPSVRIRSLAYPVWGARFLNPR
jgi:hypothetical protein